MARQEGRAEECRSGPAGSEGCGQGGGRGGKVRYVQGRMLMGRTRGKVRCLGLQGRTGLQLPLEGWERGVQRWGWGGV